MERINLPDDEYYPIISTMYEALDRYVNNRLPPGGFLTSVLSNDLVGAVARADHWNKTRIPELVGYITHHVPEYCWGSPEIVDKWLNRKD